MQVLQLFLPCSQMVGKLGGEGMSHLNSSSVSVEPSLYYPGQKRPGEDGGKRLIHPHSTRQTAQCQDGRDVPAFSEFL